MFWSAFDGSCVFNLNIKEEFVSGEKALQEKNRFT